MADFLNIVFGCVLMLYLPYLFAKKMINIVRNAFSHPELEIKKENVNVRRRENRFKSISATEFYEWLLEEEFIKMD